MLPTHRPPTHPGEMLLEDVLKPSGVTQAEAARRMGIPFQRLNAIIRGRRAVSAETAVLLEGLTRMDAEFWLTLQTAWDLWHPRRRSCDHRVIPIARPCSTVRARGDDFDRTLRRDASPRTRADRIRTVVAR